MNEVMGMGALKSPFDIRDYTIVAKAKNELPEAFELPRLPVKNQGSTGSCVAHSLALIVEQHHKRQHDEERIFSTEFIYGHREVTDYQGEGMILRQALKGLLNYGDVPASVLTGNHAYPQAKEKVEARQEELEQKAYPHRISAYFRLYSEEEIKTALMTYGYVAISMPWYPYKLDNNFVYCPTSKTSTGGHAVVIYGWNDKGWKIQNSWGELWGDRGCFKLPYDFKYNEAWCAVDNITDLGEYKKKNNGPVARVVYRAINWVVNMVTSISSKIKMKKAV